MSGMVEAEEAADALFQTLHGNAHASNPDWTSAHSSECHPGEAKAYVTCEACGFVVGVAYRDPLEVAAYSEQEVTP